MRKRYRVLVFAAIVAVLAVPVGFALSVETTTTPPVPVRWIERSDASPVLVLQSANARLPMPAISRRTAMSAGKAGDGFSDGAMLFATGTALLALAAAVRRAM